MNYVVPGMKLIPQDRTMSCWYASGFMLIEWRRRRTLMTERAHPDPSQVARWGKLYDANTGITNKMIADFAADLGLRMVPPMSPTTEGILQWLIQHGPLWVNGKSHITVIAGIRDAAGGHEVLVFDPAMPAKVHGEWRKLSTWYALDGHSGRDTGSDVQTVFLYVPLGGL
jgi:hypothetical protein